VSQTHESQSVSTTVRLPPGLSTRTASASASSISALRAEELDDTLPQTHFTRSAIYVLLRRYEDAEAATRRAIQLDPNYADGYGQLAYVLLHAGRPEEALTAIYQAKAFNPHYPFVYLWIEGQIQYLTGQYEKAAASFREVLERNPAFATARLTLVASYGHLGMEDDARWEVEELSTLRPGYSLSAAREEFLYRRPEDLEKVIEGLRRAGIPR